MGGNVSPFEWIVPPVAVAHHSLNEASKVVGTVGKTAHLPGFGSDSQPQAPTLGTPIAATAAGPQTPEEELASRRRATEARLRLGESGRASDQLTTTGSLG